MPKSDKGVVKRTIVTPDKHFPLHDQRAINCLKKTIEKVKPDDIYKVIEELNKGAEELGKLTLEEQMERAKKKQADSAVVK